jgi:hypothetical protein
VVEAAVAVWPPVEEAETAPVMVVEKAEPWGGSHRHGAQEAHSLRALLVEDPEKVVVVETPDNAGTPARAWCRVHVVVQRGAPGAPGPHVAQLKAPSPRQVRQMAPKPRVVQEEAQAPPEQLESVVYLKNLLEKEKQKQTAAPPGQKTWTQCQDPEWV